ncbi:conjugative relaxase domain-containing protein, TrwC/TraI family [Pedobacter suwonensis]|uniref:Conjugative relaxase domain-containing protein, TrwC/TraI family n=1 Tax=Pedobacter suwonensis TaxID=332999 RepID=A0A1I0TSR8_9SPHI|nr:MobF family relaxase [Pedobacter suwonensis]SFA54819.1 conjugative relaxase domain-containing protein, TrwC/TraI family [Pedobacter suwonensis]
MLRFTQSKSAEQAKNYFSQALQTSDYFISDVELPGQFHGELAKKLGISGMATKEAFYSLCENINPVTGKMLTQRTREDRTVGYDITFSVPKSVSIVNALYSNSGIQEVFQQSVNETMKLIEADIMTRVRVGGKDEDRKGNGLIWAEFTHLSARAIDEYTAPDPFLHCHAYAFNATYDEVEGKIKAAQWQFSKRDAPYYQSIFYKKLTDKLIDLGYSVRKQGKSFELEGVPPSVIALMSKRTKQVEDFALEHGITGDKAKSELGARTRTAKRKGLTLDQLKADWKRQINAHLADKPIPNTPIRFARTKEPVKTSVIDCIDTILTHSYERASVMPERRLLAHAYMHSLGNRNTSIIDIDSAFKSDKRIIHVKDNHQTMCTTTAVLKEEQHMVSLAQNGIGVMKPLYSQMPETNLEGQQYDVAKHLLTTRDRVSIYMGAAGSGKTTLMKEVVPLIERTGCKVTIVAPTAQASRIVLGKDFKDAETVAKLLIDEKIQRQLQDGILWMDEAGLSDNKQMIACLELAKKYNARVVLGGDTRQHSAVSRGQALKILNTVGGIKAAEVNKIYRQRDLVYREAVEDMAKGKMKDALTKLDRIEAIKEIDPLKPNEQLVSDYTSALKKGKSALIVSPTHEQIGKVTKDVRLELRKMNLIGKHETQFTRLRNLNLTEAEKSDWRNFQPDQVVQFMQNLPKIKRGSQYKISEVENGKVKLVNKDGEISMLPLDKANKFNVYQPSEMQLSKGDKVRITQNSYDVKGKRVDNGQALQLKRINNEGCPIYVSEKSDTEYQFEKDFGHIDYNYCTTSHASQGHTVDETFVSMPVSTLMAADSKQFYVSTSRGKEAVHIYTDDKVELLKIVQVDKKELSAIELMQKGQQRDYALGLRKDNEPEKAKQFTKEKQLNYEPEL